MIIPKRALIVSPTIAPPKKEIKSSHTIKLLGMGFSFLEINEFFIIS